MTVDKEHLAVKLSRGLDDQHRVASDTTYTLVDDRRLWCDAPQSSLLFARSQYASVRYDGMHDKLVVKFSSSSSSTQEALGSTHE